MCMAGRLSLFGSGKWRQGMIRSHCRGGVRQSLIRRPSGRNFVGGSGDSPRGFRRHSIRPGRHGEMETFDGGASIPENDGYCSDQWVAGIGVGQREQRGVLGGVILPGHRVQVVQGLDARCPFGSVDPSCSGGDGDPYHQALSPGSFSSSAILNVAPPTFPYGKPTSTPWRRVSPCGGRSYRFRRGKPCSACRASRIGVSRMEGLVFPLWRGGDPESQESRAELGRRSGPARLG